MRIFLALIQRSHCQLTLSICCILIVLLACSIHVVFGQVLSGQDLVRQLEDLPIDRNSRPLQDAAIASCGELVKASKGTLGRNIPLTVSVFNPFRLQLRKTRNAESVLQPPRRPTATTTSRKPSRSNAKRKRKRKPRRSVRASTPSPATVKCNEEIMPSLF